MPADVLPERLFAPLGPSYERAGRLLSLGLEHGWRRRLVDRAAPRDGGLHLDVATGTGLVARALRRRADCRVVGIDLTPGMLGSADRDDRIRFVQARAERLPFSDASFDGLTVTYLLRYVDDPVATMRELARVVRPGGRIAMLEFSRPRSLPLRLGWWAYTRVALPLLGSLLSRDWRAVGAFLGGSIDRFYDRHDIEQVWRDAGICNVASEELGMGAAIVVTGEASEAGDRSRAPVGIDGEAGSAARLGGHREPSSRSGSSRAASEAGEVEGGPRSGASERSRAGAAFRSGQGAPGASAAIRASERARRRGPPEATSPASEPPPPSRAVEPTTPPAFYALNSGGWRDYVTLLHPPYTLWHLSYVVLGTALASDVRLDRMAGTLVAFFLALGIGAHALDELNGRPLRTRIPTGVLRALAVLGLAGAVALGIAAAATVVGPGLYVFVAAGIVLALGYPLELAGGRLHSDLWFAVAWGAFPVLTGAYASGGSIGPAALAGAAYAVALSYAQRVLSTWVRMLRRRSESVHGEIALAGGERIALDRRTLMAAPEAGLQWLTAVAVLAPLAILAARLLP